MIVQRLDGQPLQEIGLSLFVFRRRLGTCISANALTIERLTATLTFLCVVKRGEYFLDRVTWNCLYENSVL